jgi:fructosamine-3-kinase
VKIIFSNLPKIDPKIQDNISFIIDAKKKIFEICEKHSELFGSNITITYFNKGVSSLVVRIHTEAKESYVLKISRNNYAELEATIFERWSAIGVSVPKTFANGQIGIYSYVIMEHINSSTLGEQIIKNRFIAPQISKNIGKTLARIHQIKTKGFGSLSSINLAGLYKHYKDEFANYFISNNIINHLLNSNLVNDKWIIELNLAKRTIENLEMHTDNYSTIGHMDFSPFNLFSTDPITVFDPDPSACFPIIDLAQTLISSIRAHGYLPIHLRNIILSYEKESGRQVDMELLKAACLIQGLRKLNHLIINDRNDAIQKILPFLESIVKNKKLDF